jgi:hypothetical protein
MRYHDASNAGQEVPMRCVLACVALVGLAGCHVNVVDRPPSNLDPVIGIGTRGDLGYRILPGASTEIPAGDIGFLVTGNGRGTFRVAWVDTANSLAVFSGTITTDGALDVPNTLAIGRAQIQVMPPSTITFTSAPGASVDGVDLTTTSGEILLDALVDNSHDGFGIFFTGAGSSLVLDALSGTTTQPLNPVAFELP